MQNLESVTLGLAQKDDKEFHQEMMGLPYESTPEKTEPVVMFDHRSCNGSEHPRFKHHCRSRARRVRDHFPEPTRATVPEGFSLSRGSKDRLGARVLDDACRVMSNDHVDG